MSTTLTEKQEYVSLGSLCKGSIVATNDLSAEIEKKAPLDSPEFEGQPLAPDPTFESQPGQIANIGYVNRVVDETSPLVAKSFTVPKNGEDGSGAASTVYFRPRFFGMVNGDRMKSFIVRKRLQATAAVEVQVQLKTESGAVVATTKPQTLPAESGVYVPFEFPASVALASKDALYKLVFCNASTGAELAANLNFYIYPSANPDCYFGASLTFVPELTMQFYSWASNLAVKPTTFTEGNLAKFDSNGNSIDSEIPSVSVITFPVYNGTNHKWLQAYGGQTPYSDPEIQDFNKSGEHDWSPGRRCIVYMRLHNDTGGTRHIQIYVNLRDTDHIVIDTWLNPNIGEALPVFLNADDTLMLTLGGDSSVTEYVVNFSVYFVE